MLLLDWWRSTEKWPSERILSKGISANASCCASSRLQPQGEEQEQIELQPGSRWVFYHTDWMRTTSLWFKRRNSDLWVRLHNPMQITDAFLFWMCHEKGTPGSLRRPRSKQTGETKRKPLFSSLLCNQIIVITYEVRHGGGEISERDPLLIHFRIWKIREWDLKHSLFWLTFSILANRVEAHTACWPVYSQ